MKKVIFALVASAFCLSGMATKTAKVAIVVTSNSGTSDYVSFTEDDSYADEYKSGVDAVKMFSTPVSKTVLAWTKASYKDSLAAVGLKNFEDVPFIVKTNKVDTEYKLSFNNVSGRQLTLFDAVENKEIIISEGGEYEFTADKETVLADRFILEKLEPAFCHQYGHLIIEAHQGESLVVTDMAGNEKINVTLATKHEVVELTTLTAGEQYKVILNGAEPVIIRK